MSRKVSSNGVQNPLADTSSRAWSPVIILGQISTVLRRELVEIFWALWGHPFEQVYVQWNVPENIMKYEFLLAYLRRPNQMHKNE